MAEKKVEKKSVKKDTAMISYMFGIISIVMAIIEPLAGLIFGIIGLHESKKQGDDLSARARKYNTIGIILSIVLLIVSIVISYYSLTNGLGPFSNLPID